MSAQEWDTYLVRIREGTRNDMEAFFNLAYLMAEEIAFPLSANWLGQPVMVTGIDLTYSSHSHGLKVKTAVSKEPLPIEEIEFIEPDANSLGWINFYHAWRAGNLP